MAFGGIMKGAPVLAAAFYLVIIGWIASVEKLAHMFQENEKKGGGPLPAADH